MSNSETEDDKQWMSFGKGGAGNIRKATSKALPSDALQTPPLKTKNYSTGRGGMGNMARNALDKPEIARKSQDVDVPAIKIAEQQHHIGRGGAANTYNASEDEVKAAREHDGKVRTSSTSSSERPKVIAGLVKKIVRPQG